MEERHVTRLAPLTQEEMTDEQRRVYEKFRGVHTRTGVAITHLTWLRSPGLADCLADFGPFVRWKCLDYRKRELTILIVGRLAKQPVEWLLHLPYAREAGIEEHIITALAERRRPEFTLESDIVLYDVVSALMENYRIDQATYDRAMAVLGAKDLVELVALAGYYVMMAMQIGTFDFRMPEGEKPAFTD
jgi:4-carboxymuconolactone decarboxylase